MPFLAHLCAPHDIISVKKQIPVVGHTFCYTVSKFEVNPIDGSRDIDTFVHPL